MKKYLFTLIITLISIKASAQNCDCNAIYQWTKQTFEENDAGYSYIIDKKGQQAYDLHNQITTTKIKKIKDPLACEAAIKDWLSFFRLAHVDFRYTQNNSNQNKKKSIAIDSNSLNSNELYRQYILADTPFLVQVNSSTIYLRIPSFGNQHKKSIDQIIAHNRQLITSTPNLIIDIRNGTGGSDNSYYELLPFLYTNPIRMPAVEFLSTPLNNKRMYELATNTGIAQEFKLNPSAAEMERYKTYYELLNNNIGTFVNLSGNKVNVKKLDTIYSYPNHIAIMINENNVSTDEQFLLEAKQSKKVKLYGRTTKGGLDVSNLSLVHSPNKDFVLIYALSKSLRIPEMAIDDKGVQPDYYIDQEIPESRWIDYVLENLK